MKPIWLSTTVLFLSGFAVLPSFAQTKPRNCSDGVSLAGMVLDPDGAVIPGAVVHAGHVTARTDAGGHYVLPCVKSGLTALTASANGFQQETLQLKKAAGGEQHLDFHLALARVNTNVQVDADDNGVNLDSDNGIGTHTLTQKQIQQLADDPDDFKRELQILAAANGGAPGAARITVNGFENASALPPKASIARIVTAPDMFSAEYDDPPYRGGRVEIFTKPGADSIHGALFYTDSDGSFNATDPFSTVPTPAGKRRYGFQLSGPIVKSKSDYSLALEKRDIDEFNEVNAFGLNANDSITPLRQTVEAPQHLWIASARLDWQATSSDVFTMSYSANTNELGNQGIGGFTTADAGFNSTVSEYDLRATNTQTISANLLHETRLGWTWKDTSQTPLSTAPAVQVSGFFSGGGNTAQNLNDRERDLEIDDDFLYSHGRQTWKIGAQSLGVFVHDVDPSTFNGAYTFGGGIAPVLDANNQPTGQTTVISALEQYRRALLNLPGGTPTTYQITTGTALVPLTQWQLALYGEDTIKLSPRLTFSAGLRYALQTTPSSFVNFAPRAGIAWAVDRHSKTILHLHGGLFSSVVPVGIMTEAYRLNGIRQTEAMIYAPSYQSPLTPTAQSLAVTTVRQLPSSLAQEPSFQSGVGIEHQFPHHWHAQAKVFYAESWGDFRSRNINAPMVATVNGVAPDPNAALRAPRPIAANENIFDFEATGHLSGDVIFAGVDQHSYRRFGFFLGYLRFNLTNDFPSNAGFVQSAYSNHGETARPDWEARNRVFFFGNLNLPRKVEVSSETDLQSGAPYNVTTGTDDNGDGVFNDRPSYAAAPGPGVYATRFGLLTPDATNGDVPRDVGTMPMLVHVDMNVSRAWKVGGGGENGRTVTLNARAANLLNHTNVSAVSTVVGSPSFSQAVAAEAARRVELGIRFQF